MPLTVAQIPKNPVDPSLAIVRARIVAALIVAVQPPAAFDAPQPLD
jgi:hypothetical protein